MAPRAGTRPVPNVTGALGKRERTDGGAMIYPPPTFPRSLTKCQGCPRGLDPSRWVLITQYIASLCIAVPRCFSSWKPRRVTLYKCIFFCLNALLLFAGVLCTPLNLNFIFILIFVCSLYLISFIHFYILATFRFYFCAAAIRLRGPHLMICDGYQGYNYSHNKQCVTIFSAPNYCYRCGTQAPHCISPGGDCLLGQLSDRLLSIIDHTLLFGVQPKSAKILKNDLIFRPLSLGV